MTRDRLIYASLVAFSALVGLMLAGGPGALSSSALPDDLLPATTTTVASASPSGATATSDVADSSPTSTGEVTVDEDAVTETTAEETTTIAAETTTSTIAVETTIEPRTPTDVSVPQRERLELAVAVGNGIGSPGVAGRGAELLGGLGYADPATRDAPATETTTVYYAGGLESEASRLAVDIGLDPFRITSIAELSGLEGSGPDLFDLVLVIGSDFPI